MNGRFIVSVIVICAALAGAAMFYLQIYGFYDDVSETDNRVVLTASSVRFGSAVGRSLSAAASGGE